MEGAVSSTQFTSDGRLLAAGVTGLRLWDIQRKTSRLLQPCKTKTVPLLAGSLADRFLLAEVELNERRSWLTYYDLRSDSSHELTSHGTGVRSVALDSTGEIAVTGGYDGIVRVGPVSGEEPHLLFGHQLEVTSVAVSPDGNWIASGSQDGTIRLWPMPKGTPFHELRYEEILERIRSSTNLRVGKRSRLPGGARAFPWLEHASRAVGPGYRRSGEQIIGDRVDLAGVGADIEHVLGHVESGHSQLFA
jgi:WD40 repeat protein